MNRTGALSSALLICAALAAGRIDAGEETIKLADDKNRNTVVAGCITCHSLDYITMNAPLMDRGKWEKTVQKMIDVYKAPISKENAAVILEYLSKHYVAAR
mgnify:CR=1 FL=1